MNKDWRVCISGYLDGELDPAEREAFEREAARDPELARELEALRALKEVTSGMKLSEFPDYVWDRYWEGTYNRLERRIGWLFLSLGAAALLAGGLYELVLGLIKDTSEPLWMRVAIGAACGGLAILFVSALRERLFMLRRDPYREVKR
jgi:anti-sigma factor RsiW